MCPGKAQIWPQGNNFNNFGKGSPNDVSYKIWMLLALWFVTRRFFPFSAILLPWQPEFLLELNSFNNFCRASPKEHSCQVLSRLAFWFWRRRFLKKLLTDGQTDGWTEGRRPVTIAPPEHVVLRWAKKSRKLFDRWNLLSPRPVIWPKINGA